MQNFCSTLQPMTLFVHLVFVCLLVLVAMKLLLGFITLCECVCGGVCMCVWSLCVCVCECVCASVCVCV